LGRLVASHREHVASDVAKCEVTTKRAPDGSVDRESVGSASGFPFGSLPSAVGSRRRSSFPARARPALGFRLSQVSRVRPLLQRARADGAEWSVAFHRSPGRGSPAAESAHGFCVRGVGLAMTPVSNTDSSSCTEMALLCARRPFALARRDAVWVRRPPPLTSLQRVEATDALPIRVRWSYQSRRGSTPCLRFCTVRAEI
jgi:hypothetical protein